MSAGKAALRPMLAEDYDAVFALWRAIPGMGLRKLDDSREGITKYLARNPGLSFVAEAGGKLVGAILCGHDGRRGMIYHTAVLPEHRGGGTGKALVAAALAALKAEGIAKAMLVCFGSNEIGNGFWRGQGWRLREDLNYYDCALAPDNPAL